MVKRYTTTRELIGWSHYLQLKKKEEAKRKEKWETYAASINAEIRRSFVKKPTKVKTEDFYHEFTFGTEEEVRKLATREERTRIAKSAWGAMFGMDLTKEN